MALLRWSQWRLAWRLAWRDLRVSRRRALIMLLAVAAGTASVVAVRAAGRAMHARLTSQAREWIAADLSVFLPEAPSPEELSEVQNLGLPMTEVTEFISMITAPSSAESTLSFMKVVDPDLYPLRGAIGLSTGQHLRAVLRGDSIVVSKDLLARLNISVGSPIRLGRGVFQVAAAIDIEPDWSAGVSTVLPRVLLSYDQLRRSGLIPQGSVPHKLLFTLEDRELIEVRGALERIFPEGEVVDYRDPDHGAAVALESARRFLVIASWLVLLFGAMAMAAAMYLHAQSRLDATAIFKALGARSNLILATYVIQVVWLSLGGGFLGVLAAIPMAQALVNLLHRVLPVGFVVHLEPRLVLEALLACLVSALPAVAGPIWSLRKLPPLPVLRRHVERVAAEPPVAALWRSRSMLATIAGRQLFRRGRHTLAIVLFLAAGIAVLTATAICQSRISSHVADSVPARGSNLYIISAGRDQVNEAAAWLRGQPGVESALEAFPLVWLRLKQYNGAAVQPGSGMQVRWLATCSDQGRPGEVLLSREEDTSGLRPGDALGFAVKGRLLEARVGRSSPGFLNAVISVLIFDCGSLSGLPVYYHAAVSLKPSAEQRVRVLLSRKFPQLPVLSQHEFTGLVSRTAGTAVTMMQLLCWSILILGLGLEVALVAATRSLRQNEIAIWKVLGARPAKLARLVVAEFGLLGMAAGCLGGVLGTIAASLILSRVERHLTLGWDAWIFSVAVLGGTLLSAAAGLAAMAPFLPRRPMQLWN
ncbi:MAG: ABC transporter permease [Acidobacteria bacterium]|nr:ABC transporter permease [Acidobacteriota bacterium]